MFLHTPRHAFYDSVSNTAGASFVMNFHQYLKVEFFTKITTNFGVIFKNFTTFLVIFKTNTSYNFISIRNIPVCSCLQNFFQKVCRILKKLQCKHFITSIFLAKSVSYLKITTHSL